MADVLQKIIADSGLASRRQAETLIRGGAVKINGEKAKLGDRAEPDKDKITVKGKPLPKKQSFTYLKLNKPTGYTCSNRKFPGEKNIYDLVKNSSRLFSIGRLDKDSRGLILLTNDGALTQKLSHPKYRHEKIYVVKADQGDRQELTIKTVKLVLQKLRSGVDIGEGDGVVRAKDSQYLENNTFKVILTEGKKRQVRRMFRSLKMKVYDLKRIEFAGVRLDKLEEGAIKPLTEKEITALKNK